MVTLKGSPKVSEAGESPLWKYKQWEQKQAKQQRDTNFIPAEKLTTGKNRPSILKFSNIPWTGCPLMRNEMLGALRSKQQLITSSVLNKCWLGELTVRAIQPVGETVSKVRFNTENQAPSYCKSDDQNTREEHTVEANVFSPLGRTRDQQSDQHLGLPRLDWGGKPHPENGQHYAPGSNLKLHKG